MTPTLDAPPVKVAAGAEGLATVVVAFLEGEGTADTLGGGGHSMAPRLDSSEASLASGRTEWVQEIKKELLTFKVLLTAGVSLRLDAFQEF